MSPKGGQTIHRTAGTGGDRAFSLARERLVSAHELTLGARDRTVLSRFWLEFGFLASLQHGEISRRFGVNIFYTGQFDGYTGSASIA